MTWARPQWGACNVACRNGMAVWIWVSPCSWGPYTCSLLIAGVVSLAGRLRSGLAGLAPRLWFGALSPWLWSHC